MHFATAGNEAFSPVSTVVWQKRHSIFSGACFLWLK